MVVVHFIASNFVGGPEKQILTHLTALKKIGVKPYLISFDEEGGWALKEQANNINVKCILLPSPKLSILKVYKNLRNELVKLQTDIICAHGFKAGFYSMLIKLALPTKVIAFSRGWTSENIKIYIYTMIDKFVIRFADRIVAVSDSQKARLVKNGINEKLINVVKNAVTIGQNELGNYNSTALRQELNIRNTDKILFTAGRLSPEKGHRYLLEAYENVYQKYKQTNLVLAGSGPEEGALKQQIENYSSKNNIHFLGFREDIKSLYQQTDIFILPSLSEGLPNVVLEAMAYKLPVISTNVGGVPEIIENMNNGLLVEASNSLDLGNAIELLLKDSKLMNQLSINGEQTVFDEFSPEKQTEQLVELYKEVLVANVR